MTIIKIDGRRPSAPSDLTEQAVSAPVAPTNLTEQAKSEPLAPTNLTEQAKSAPSIGNTLNAITENLLLQSEVFNNAIWSKIGDATITANVQIAPNGTATADLFSTVLGGSGNRLAQSYAIPDITETYTWSVYVKNSTATQAVIRVQYTGAATYSEIVSYTFASNETTTSGSAATTYATTTDVGDGWYRISVTSVKVGDVVGVDCRIYGGGTTGNFWIWGGQLNRGSLASYIQTTTSIITPQVIAPTNLTEIAVSEPTAPSNLTEIAVSEPLAPTNLTEIADSTPLAPVNLTELADAGINRTLSTLFNFNAALGLPDSVTYSRSSSASYIETFKGPLGRYQKRITTDYVGSVENLITYSEDFDNAAWTKTSGAVFADKELSPFGNRNADRFIPDTSTTNHNLLQTLSFTTGLTYTLSFYAKAESISLVQMFLGSAAFAADNYVNFDLSTGTITGSASAIGSIRFISNGWYMCSITATATASASTSVRITSLDSPSTTRNSIYASDGISSFLVWSAQLTQSTKPLPYVRTFEAAVTQSFTASPRYEEKGLLVEGASTNLAIRSEEVDNASWSKINSSVLVNQILAPDGSYSADLMVEDGVNGPHSANLPISFAVNTVYTFSIYLKAGKRTRAVVTVGGTGLSGAGGSGADLVSIVDLTNGAVVSSLNDLRVEDAGNGWYRCSVTVTTDSDGGSIEARINLVQGTGTTTSYAGGGAGANAGVYMWGAQFEAKPFATSYIRTEGSTVTRALDNPIEKQTILNIVPRFSILTESFDDGLSSSASRTLFALNGGNTQNRVQLGYNNAGLVSFTTVDNVFQGSLTAPLESGKKFTACLVFDSGVMVLYLNGVIVDTQNIENPTRNGLSILDIGQLTSSQNFLNGHIKRLEIYDLALTANEVKKL